LSEVVHIRRIPRTRVKLIRVHSAQADVAEHVIPSEEPRVTPHHNVEPDTIAIQSEPEAYDPAEALTGAYTRGVDEGRRLADVKFQESLAKIRHEEDERIAVIMAGIGGQVHELQKTLESDAYKFALAVAGRIVKHEVTIQDDIVIAQIREAIQRIMGVETIKLRVHPADESVVQSHRNAFLSSLGNVREMIIEADERVERGGCIIESPSGNIDARISTQLHQIEAALFGASSNGGDGLP
jgi:flagellar assembly protein FliH